MRENYELGRQLRRAAFSIPTNIAEGSAHSSRAHYAHYLTIAAASASEVDYLTLACADLKLLNHVKRDELRGEAIRIRRQLSRLVSAVRSG